MLESGSTFLVGQEGHSAQLRDNGASPEVLTADRDTQHPPILLRLNDDIVTQLTLAVSERDQISLGNSPSGGQTLIIRNEHFPLNPLSERGDLYRLHSSSGVPRLALEGSFQRYAAVSVAQPESALEEASARLRERRQEDDQRKREHQAIVFDDQADLRKIKRAHKSTSPENHKRSTSLSRVTQVSKRLLTASGSTLRVVRSSSTAPSMRLRSVSPDPSHKTDGLDGDDQDKVAFRASGSETAVNASEEANSKPETSAASTKSVLGDGEGSRAGEKAAEQPARTRRTLDETEMMILQQAIIQLLARGPLSRRKIVRHLAYALPADSDDEDDPGPIPEPTILKALVDVAHAPQNLQPNTDGNDSKPAHYAGPVNRRQGKSKDTHTSGTTSTPGTVFALRPEVFIQDVTLDWPDWDTETRRSVAFAIEDAMREQDIAEGSSEWTRVHERIWKDGEPSAQERAEHASRRQAEADHDISSGLSEPDSDYDTSIPSPPKEATPQTSQMHLEDDIEATREESDSLGSKQGSAQDKSDQPVSRSLSRPSQRDRMIKTLTGKSKGHTKEIKRRAVPPGGSRESKRPRTSHGDSPEGDSKRRKESEVRSRKKKSDTKHDLEKEAQKKSLYEYSSDSSRDDNDFEKRVLSNMKSSSSLAAKKFSGDGIKRSKTEPGSSRERMHGASRSHEEEPASMSQLTKDFEMYRREYEENSRILEEEKQDLLREQRILREALQYAKSKTSASEDKGNAEVEVTLPVSSSRSAREERIIRLVDRQKKIYRFMEKISIHAEALRK